LVAASPRWAVSQVFNLPHAACEQRSADYKSAIRQIENLRYDKQIPAHGRAAFEDLAAALERAPSACPLHASRKISFTTRHGLLSVRRCSWPL
jgi:hypothetical protein